MNSFAKVSLVVALAVVGSAWSQVGQAQQTHDAVAKARGEVGEFPVVRQPIGRYMANRPTAQLPTAVAQRPTSNAARTFSYDPNQSLTSQPVAQSVPAQPQHPGFHDAGAKVRGEFAK